MDLAELLPGLRVELAVPAVSILVGLHRGARVSEVRVVAVPKGEVVGGTLTDVLLGLAAVVPRIARL